MASIDLHVNQVKNTLNFFCLLVLTLGIWMAFPSVISDNISRLLTSYCPLWILSIIFIGGASINIIFKKRFLVYLLFISIPLMFLALLFIQSSFIQGNIAPGAIFCTFLAGYSAIHAGRAFEKQIFRIPKKI